MIRTAKVEFPGAQGVQLAGRLDLPVGTPLAFALFAHCFTCSKDVFAAQRISQGLAERGIAVLRFDFTGLGHSGGEFANTHFSSNVDDLLAAAEWLRSAHQAPQLLIGHSLGGAAVLLAAGRIPETRGVVTLNAPCDPAHVKHLFQDDIPRIDAEGAAEVRLEGRTFTIRKEFLTDISAQPMREAIHKLRKALLIFHAPQDQTVSIDSARAIYDAALHPKSFVTLDGADHLITRREDAAYAADVIAAWAARYVVQSRPAAEWPTAAPGTVIVAGAGEGVFPQLVSMHGHRTRADEPVSAGGFDSGPGPYDLLLAALGACTAMTVRMYANQKKWPLTDVQVTLKHQKIYAQDCAECETKEGKVDEIDRSIRLVGDLDDTQRKRLMEIADKCPVHRTLHSEIRILSRMEG